MISIPKARGTAPEPAIINIVSVNFDLHQREILTDTSLEIDDWRTANLWTIM
jgi:hypothetical protein